MKDVQVGRIVKLSDGGPAFPPQDRVLVTSGPRFDPDELRRLKDALAHAQQTGMALRDFFAAAALSPVIQTQPLAQGNADVAAATAYAVADAMLRVREQK